MERFEKVIADIHNADNKLLEEFTHLSECYKALRLQVNKLSAENEQLKTELVNMVRSLDLASRVDGMTGLANRRDIMEKIDREATRSQRHQPSRSPFCWSMSMTSRRSTTRTATTPVMMCWWKSPAC